MFCNNPACEKYLDEVTEEEVYIDNSGWYICNSCKKDSIYETIDIMAYDKENTFPWD